jgi:hypothetical protein
MAVGLHNPNDWRYRQRRSNLFDTYLGNSPAADSPYAQAVGNVRQGPVESGKSPAEAIARFLVYNATVDDANRFLAALGKSKGVVVEPSKSPWDSIRRLCRSHFTTEEQVRYLTELRRRKASGEALVQR